MIVFVMQNLVLWYCKCLNNNATGDHKKYDKVYSDLLIDRLS